MSISSKLFSRSSRTHFLITQLYIPTCTIIVNNKNTRIKVTAKEFNGKEK